jgi:hypothetical protein
MRIVGHRYWEVAPIRAGIAIYYIHDCCALRHLSLLDSCAELNLEADFFCRECWARVFWELWGGWWNLTHLRLQVNSVLHYDVVHHIEDMWQGPNQLVSITLGSISVPEEDQERIENAFANLRVFYIFR